MSDSLHLAFNTFYWCEAKEEESNDGSGCQQFEHYAKWSCEFLHAISHRASWWCLKAWMLSHRSRFKCREGPKKAAADRSKSCRPWIHAQQDLGGGWGESDTDHKPWPTGPRDGAGARRKERAMSRSGGGKKMEDRKWENSMGWEQGIITANKA